VAAAELVVALAASYLFLGERLALLQLFGAVLIMSAGVLLQRQPPEQRVAQSRSRVDREVAGVTACREEMPVLEDGQIRDE
ncbi:MAG: DMT family transporter, partial [Chloroflexi bacterium]|nr:DMT family transporter [Chloroflexota bacterium]